MASAGNRHGRGTSTPERRLQRGLRAGRHRYACHGLLRTIAEWEGGCRSWRLEEDVRQGSGGLRPTSEDEWRMLVSQACHAKNAVVARHGFLLANTFSARAPGCRGPAGGSGRSRRHRHQSPVPALQHGSQHRDTSSSEGSHAECPGRLGDESRSVCPASRPEDLRHQEQVASWMPHRPGTGPTSGRWHGRAIVLGK